MVDNGVLMKKIISPNGENTTNCGLRDVVEFVAKDLKAVTVRSFNSPEELMQALRDDNEAGV